MTLYPWQMQQWQRLMVSLSNHEFPHALLLTGPVGMGKQLFALKLAARLLCSGDSIWPCDTCRSCQWIKNQTHPDLLFLKCAPDSKVIKIDQVRHLLELLAQTSQQNKRQVVLIDPAEAMNTAAANALLKVLEEPTGEIVFLLISHQPGALLSTIRSRCQHIVFPTPPSNVSLAWLKEQLPEQHHQIDLFLTLAEYVPLRALTFMTENRREIHTKIVDYFIDRSLSKINDIEPLSTFIEAEFHQLFDVLWSVFMDLVRLKLNEHLPVSNVHKLQELIQISRKYSSAELFVFVDGLLQAKKFVEDKLNINMKLFWEGLFTRWAS